MKKILLFAIIAFSMQLQCMAQPFNAAWANQFQTALNTAVSANNIKGASIAIYSPGQGYWTGVSGNSSLGSPITADMRFGISSNTKLFMATVMLRLQEQGILSLNDHISQWLPSMPNIDSTATIRQLLSNQTGFFDYINDNASFWNDSIWTDTSRFWTPQEILSTIGAPHFAPGMGCHYSNTNFLLAVKIIEVATGNSWVQNLHTYILTPLNMTSTFVGAFEAPNGPVAHLWDATWGEVSSPMTSLFSSAVGSGGILSTAGEMAKWYNALFSGALLADSSLKEIINFQPIHCAYIGFNYGLGLEESYHSDPSIDRAFFHTGGMPGYRSVMWYDIRSKSVISMMTNGGLTNNDLILGPLLTVLHDQYPTQANDAGIRSILSPWDNGCSASITPSVSLRNYGSNLLSSVDIHYKIDGGAPAVFNWTGMIGTNGQVAVTLPTIVATNGSHVFTCYTSAPNGATEGYTYNDTAKSDFITNTTAIASFVPLTENFEGAVFPPAGWNVHSKSIPYQWGQTCVAPFNGKNSAAIGGAGVLGAKYDLDMPMIHLTGVTNPELDFEYAYTYYPGYYDSLNVMISSDCGLSWQSLFYKGGTTLKTATPIYDYFFPTATQWKHETISLAAYTGDVMIRFRYICGRSNNLFIDAVHIGQSTDIASTDLDDKKIAIYPNPFTTSTTIAFTVEQKNTVINVIDIVGNVISSHKFSGNQFILEKGTMLAGIYLVQIIDETNQTYNRTIIIQ
jgi:CubicO group peptidase (beta-lactamase class C family)